MPSRLLVVDDERLIRWSLEQTLEKAGYEVATAEDGASALISAREEPPDLVLLDLKLPDTDGIQVLRQLKDQQPGAQVVIMTAYADVGTAVEAMRLGAYDYLPKPIDFDSLAVTLRNALEARQLRRKVEQLREKLSPSHFDHIVGPSRAMQDVVGLARKVSASGATSVLIQGESGTGKDVVAKAVHYASARADGPFMEVTCTAMPETLLESELFGHERGAFTDAKVQKKGLLELAHGGTLFLDEIGDMAPALQAKLLRVLEERRFRRVGGTRDISVDIRVVAATNRDLRVAVEQGGTFRKDLYYRLQVVTITIPPLRERREDIAPLAHHFLQHFSREFKKPLPRLAPAAERLLVDYGWPGNVRELRNVIERAMILAEGGDLTAVDLPPEIAGSTLGSAPETPCFQLPGSGVVLEDVERDFVRQALDLTHGNQTRAARLLGLTRDELRYRVKKFDLVHKTDHDGN